MITSDDGRTFLCFVDQLCHGWQPSQVQHNAKVFTSEMEAMASIQDNLKDDETRFNTMAELIKNRVEGSNDYRALLLQTVNADTFVSCLETDTIQPTSAQLFWTTGLPMHDANLTNPAKWPGKNTLGRAFLTVRDRILGVHRRPAYASFKLIKSNQKVSINKHQAVAFFGTTTISNNQPLEIKAREEASVPRLHTWGPTGLGHVQIHPILPQFLFRLVTRNTPYERPKYSNALKALRNLHKICTALGISDIAIQQPTDGTLPDIIHMLIRQTFRGSEFCVTLYAAPC